MPKLRIDIEGINPDTAYALAIFLLEKTGCETALETDYREKRIPRGEGARGTLPHLHASASHSFETIILTYTAAQLLPGVQEFTKAIGKKAGEAVGDIIADWFKAKFSKAETARPFALITDEKGVPVATVES